MRKTRFIILNNGQVIAEYMVLFAAFALLTLLSVCTFFPQVRQSCETAFQEAIEAIHNPFF